MVYTLRDHVDQVRDSFKEQATAKG
jgi:hypothetical protein